MKKSMKLKFKRLTKTAKLPIYATSYSAGMDIYYDGDDDLHLEPQRVYVVGTGIALDISDKVLNDWGSSLFLDLRLRSSLRAKGISSLGSGIIDLDYLDEIMVVLMNLSYQVYTIKQGDRIAQLIPIRYERQLFGVKVKEDKRFGGFGSTD